MGRMVAFLLCVSVVLAGIVAWPADRAMSGPESGGVWIYDIRVVRVDPPNPEVAEKHPTWFPEGTTTTTKPWQELLTSLKQRGTSTILLDQRVTGLENSNCTAVQKRERPVLAVNNKDLNNVQSRLTTLESGCRVKLTTNAAGVLTYDVQAMWIFDPVARTLSPVRDTEPKPGAMRVPATVVHAPVQGLTTWQGTHPSLSGNTLVLHYREQVAHEGEAAPQAMEIYTFLTGRYVAGK